MCRSHNCRCKKPSQNYIEQVVNDALADSMDRLNQSIEHVEELAPTLVNVANLKAIARVFNITDSQVASLVTGLSVNTLYLLYEPESQTTWFRDTAVGTVISWSITSDVMTLVTSVGTYTLEQATVLTSSGSSLNLDYGTL